MCEVKFQYQGVKGLQKIADHVGIRCSTLRNRIYANNMSLEEAISLGEEARKKCVYEYKGHQGLPAIARAFGIKTVTLQKRLWSGLSMEKAVSIPVGKTGQNRSYTPEIDTRYVRGVWPVSITPLWKIALGLENAK